MILDHVSKSSYLIEVASPSLDSQTLRRGDLNVVDIATIPERFKDPIGEAEHQDVLHRFLPQIVIDAVDLLFTEYLSDLPVEFPHAG